jgi:hypothetical protein
MRCARLSGRSTKRLRIAYQINDLIDSKGQSRWGLTYRPFLDKMYISILQKGVMRIAVPDSLITAWAAGVHLV